MRHRIAMLFLAGLLAGCKEDERQDAAAFCRTIGGSGATATTPCRANCGHDALAASVDGRFDTWASLNASIQSENVIRATTAGASEIPAGGHAGVYLHKPSLATGTFQVTLTTYRDDRIVDGDVVYVETSGTDGNAFCNFRCESHGDNLFLGIPASGPFDSIEIAYNQSGGTQSREIKLFEFCVRP